MLNPSTTVSSEPQNARSAAATVDQGAVRQFGEVAVERERGSGVESGIGQRRFDVAHGGLRHALVASEERKAAERGERHPRAGAREPAGQDGGERVAEHRELVHGERVAHGKQIIDARRRPVLLVGRQARAALIAARAREDDEVLLRQAVDDRQLGPREVAPGHEERGSGSARGEGQLPGPGGDGAMEQILHSPGLPLAHSSSTSYDRTRVRLGPCRTGAERPRRPGERGPAVVVGGRSDRAPARAAGAPGAPGCRDDPVRGRLGCGGRVGGGLRPRPEVLAGVAGADDPPGGASPGGLGPVGAAARRHRGRSGCGRGVAIAGRGAGARRPSASRRVRRARADAARGRAPRRGAGLPDVHPSLARARRRRAFRSRRGVRVRAPRADDLADDRRQRRQRLPRSRGLGDRVEGAR